ncbi:hypothetical protein TrRE_jg8262, partial [Triparma retinervis]
MNITISTFFYLCLAVQAALDTGVKIAFHIEAYPGRNITTITDDVRHLIRSHGGSGALHRVSGKPVFYVYRHSDIPPSDWEAAMGGLAERGFFLGMVETRGDLEGM